MAKQKNQINHIQKRDTQKQETNQPNQKEQEIKQNQESVTTEARNRFEERQPTLSRNITLSKDKKWLIIRAIRTDIVHVNYMEKILQSGDI